MNRFMPVERPHRVFSGFGPRWGTQHRGVDFGRDGGSGGMGVYAAQGGRVIMSGPADGFGFWVVIDHPTAAGSGTTVYGHVVPEVKAGVDVFAGQRIAHVNPIKGPGNGNVDPHLHFETHPTVWRQGSQFDPMPWLAGAAYVGEQPVPPVPEVPPAPLDDDVWAALLEQQTGPRT